MTQFIHMQAREFTMKKLIACTTLALSLTLPNISEAHDFHHGHGGPGWFIGDLIALPFIASATILGAAATVATAPFYAGGYYAPPAPAYYAPPVAYYRRPYAPAYYGYGPPPRVYYAPRAYPRYYYAPRLIYPGY